MILPIIKDANKYLFISPSSRTAEDLSSRDMNRLRSYERKPTGVSDRIKVVTALPFGRTPRYLKY